MRINRPARARLSRWPPRFPPIHPNRERCAGERILKNLPQTPTFRVRSSDRDGFLGRRHDHRENHSAWGVLSVLPGERVEIPVFYYTTPLHQPQEGLPLRDENSGVADSRRAVNLPPTAFRFFDRSSTPASPGSPKTGAHASPFDGAPPPPKGGLYEPVRPVDAQKSLAPASPSSCRVQSVESPVLRKEKKR